MLSAMEAVRKGTVSINKVALLHSVPRTTLKDRLSWNGRTWNTTRSQTAYLTEKEETSLRKCMNIQALMCAPLMRFSISLSDLLQVSNRLVTCGFSW